MPDNSVRNAMLDLAGDDMEAIALSLSQHIGWGNGAVFDPENRCECPACEQERDDVRAAILHAVAPALRRLRGAPQPS